MLCVRSACLPAFYFALLFELLRSANGAQGRQDVERCGQPVAGAHSGATYTLHQFTSTLEQSVHSHTQIKEKLKKHQH